MKKEKQTKLLYQILHRYLEQEVIDPTKKHPYVTIQSIWISPRGDLAKVWLSFVGQGEGKYNGEQFIKDELTPRMWEIRKEVAAKLRHATRYVPKEIRFLVDETPEKAAYISKLIEEVSSTTTA